MNNQEKEIRRIRLEDLDSSLQNILLNRISKDDPTWKKLQDIIDDLYKKTHIEKKNITITINQSDNQTIHVYVPKKIGGVDYTSAFTCLTGTTYEAEVIAENGYKAGTLNVSRSGVFINNKTINATSATKSNATVTITQSDNQTIHVYTPKKEGGTDHTSTFTCPVGTTYEAEVIAETGYTAGALNVGNSGTINSDMSINANPAISYAKVTIVQTDNQTIHVYTPQKSGGTDHTSSFTCSVGTTYEVEVIAASNYIAGTPNTKGGTFNSNMIINATSATVATAKVTIVQSDNQTIHVYTPQKSGGTDHTSSFTCPIGTTYEAEVIAASGYNAGTLNASGGGVINGDKTINATSATANIPTGYLVNEPYWITDGFAYEDITIPNGVHVVEVCLEANSHHYPDTFMRIYSKTKEWGHSDTDSYVAIYENIGVTPNKRYIISVDLDPGGAITCFYIKYSPEINKQTPTVTDY